MKPFLMSLLVFVFIVSSWFSANHFLFKDQRVMHQMLSARMSDQACVNHELSQIQKQTNYQANYANIVRTEQEFLEKEIPKTAEISGVLAALTQLANDTKVSLHDFRVGKIYPHDVWSEVPVRVTLSGDFLRLADFLEKINSSERLMVVQDLKYGDAQAELSLLVYFGNWPSEKALILKPKPSHCGDYVLPEKLTSVLTAFQARGLIYKWTRNPFILPENIPSLAGIHLVGVVLLEDNTWVALLEDDRGVAKIVKVRNPLVDGFVVSKITKNAVSVVKEGQTRQLRWSN